MAETKNLLYTLKIEGTDTELDKLVKIRGNVKALEADIKKFGDTDSAQSEQSKLQLQQQRKEYQQLQKEIVNRNKAEKDSVKTLESMRAELSNLNKQLERLPVGGKEFENAQKKAKALREEINGVDQATGKWQGNVGNYKNAIVDAFQQMGVNVSGLTQNITAARSAIQLTTASTGGLTGAMKVLGVAIISTGIGAFLIILGLVINALRKFDPIIDRIEQGMAALGAVFSSFSDTVLSVITGQKSFSEAVSGAGEAMSKAAKAAIEYTKAQQDLDDKVFKSTVNQEKYKNQIAELILQSKNRTLSEAERIKMIDEALQIEAIAFAERKDIADAELDIAQKQLIASNNLTDAEIDNLKLLGVEYAISLKDRKRVTDEQVQALVDALAKQQQVEGESIAIREKALNRRDQLEDAASEKSKKRSDEALKAKQAERELDQKTYEFLIESINSIREIKSELKENGEDVIFKLIDEEDIEDIPNILQSLQDLAAEEVDLARRTTEEIKGTYTQRLEALQAALRQGIITEEQYANRKREINGLIADDTIASLKGVAKEGTALSRGLFVFEKALAAKKALLAILEGTGQTAKVGFPQNIPLLIGFAAQVAGLIGAIKGVIAPEPPKFARGVIGIQGAGTSTSDSINAMISKDESVMTAKATRVYAPVLAEMERSVGNRPNVQIGSRRYASGFIPTPVSGLSVDVGAQIRAAVQSVASIPVVVAEGEISNVQNRVRRIKVAGDL